jgi:hypothetical protein
MLFTKCWIPLSSLFEFISTVVVCSYVGKCFETLSCIMKIISPKLTPVAQGLTKIFYISHVLFIYFRFANLEVIWRLSDVRVYLAILYHLIPWGNMYFVDCDLYLDVLSSLFPYPLSHFRFISPGLYYYGASCLNLWVFWVVVGYHATGYERNIC